MSNTLRQILRAFIALAVLPLAVIAVLPIVAVACSFWLISVATRALARLTSPEPRQWSDFIEFDPEFGWKSKPNLDAHYLVAADLYRAKTGDDGWRGRNNVSESEIVVIGDSFAWGYGVGDDEFFASLVTGVKVKPIGVMGYNLAQEVLCLKRYQAQLSGKLVVWFIYYGNDLFETLTPDMQGYRQPFIKERVDGNGWEIITRHLSEKKWFFGVNPSDSVYYEKLAEYCSGRDAGGNRAYRGLQALLEQGRDICAAAGANLVVVSIPEKTQLSSEGGMFLLQRGGDPLSLDTKLPDRMTASFCQKLNIDFVPGMEYFDSTHYLADDSHWNAAGNRRMADLLEVLWREHLSGRATGAPERPDDRSGARHETVIKQAVDDTCLS